MTEYKTVEGHEIKAGQYYETRAGTKAKIIAIDIDNDYICPIVARHLRGGVSSHTVNGAHMVREESDEDLMRPWVEKEEKKVYKLSEMWVCWHRNKNFYYDPIEKSKLYKSKSEVLNWANTVGPDSYLVLLAITKADATEFVEGEGLDGK